MQVKKLPTRLLRGPKKQGLLKVKNVLRKVLNISKKQRINTPDSALYKLERAAAQANSHGTVLSERERLLLDELVKRKRRQLSARSKAVDRKEGNVVLHGPYS